MAACAGGSADEMRALVLQREALLAMQARLLTEEALARQIVADREARGARVASVGRSRPGGRVRWGVCGGGASV